MLADFEKLIKFTLKIVLVILVNLTMHVLMCCMFFGSISLMSLQYC